MICYIRIDRNNLDFKWYNLQAEKISVRFKKFSVLIWTMSLFSRFYKKLS